MRLPPESVLLAATRWLEILPASGGILRAQALLTTHARYSDLTPTQYATALNWMRSLGLLENLESLVPAANRLLAAIFETAPPSWVRDADDLVQSPDELPSDIVLAGGVLGLDPTGIFEQLVSSWGKVDTAAREMIGAAGESELVALLRDQFDGRVDHVSTWSDGFGYDIAFTSEELVLHLEVKSTTRVGRFTAYLSRHEYEVMLRDERWTLVAVRLTKDLKIAGIGSVQKEWIVANIPQDLGTFGRWASVKLVIPEAVIVRGIPPLACDLLFQPVNAGV